MASAAGHVTTHYNLPQVSWMSNALALGDKARFRTFVRTSGLLSQVGHAAVTMHKKFGWQKAGLLYTVKGQSLYIWHVQRFYSQSKVTINLKQLVLTFLYKLTLFGPRNDHTDVSVCGGFYP